MFLLLRDCSPDNSPTPGFFYCVAPSSLKQKKTSKVSLEEERAKGKFLGAHLECLMSLSPIFQWQGLTWPDWTTRKRKTRKHHLAVCLEGRRNRCCDQPAVSNKGICCSASPFKTSNPFFHLADPCSNLRSWFMILILIWLPPYLGADFSLLGLVW